MSSAAWQEIRVGMTKRRTMLPWKVVTGGKAFSLPWVGRRLCVRAEKKPQISPLRYAPVEMTILFEGKIPRFQEKYEILAATELSSLTGAYPDFQPRCPVNDRACGFQ
jgi:hypothetical protein